MIELAESLLHFDTKLFKSLKYVILWPGKMTKEYLQNKRQRFVPPVRLYIFVSVIFFLLAQLFTSYVESHDTNVKENQTSQVDTLQNGRHQVNTGLLKISYGDEEIQAKDSLDNSNLGFWPSLLKRQADKAKKDGKSFKENVKHAAFKYISMSMFLMMPLFAFFLKIIYRSNRKNYFEFLIFAMHYQVAVFLFLILTVSLFYFSGFEHLGFLIFALLFLYLYQSLKINFGKPKIILKSILAMGFYYISNGIFMLISTIIGFFIA